MTQIYKNKFFISILSSALVSMALLGTAHAAEITVTTNNINGNTLYSNGAMLAGSIDATVSTLMNGDINGPYNFADVWFEYGTSGFLGQSTSKTQIGINYDNTLTTFNEPLNNLNPDTTYYFQAVAKNNATNLEVRGQILSFKTTSLNQSNGNSNSYYESNDSAPEVTTNSAILDSIEASSVMLDSYIKSNGSNTTAWFEYGTTDNLGQQTEDWAISTSAYQVDFQKKIQNLMPDTIYYYRAVAKNDHGTTYGSKYAVKTKEFSNGVTFSQPTILTSPAMLVRENSALLNGSAVPNNAETSVWFEWSEDPNVTINVNRSAAQSIGAGYSEVYMAYSPTNLVLGKTYYFRAIAKNSYGTSKGNILKFTTAVQVVVPKTATTNNEGAPVNNVQSQNTANTVALEAEFDNTNPRAGSKAVYAINYTNNTNSVLKDAVLKITLPNEVNYLASSFANVNQDGNTITLKIGDIAAKSTGSASVRVKITDLAKAQTIKFSAEMSYSLNGKISKENTSNELKISDYSLAASALETLGSIFTNLFVDFILGIMIGAGVYHFINKRKQVVDTEDPLK